MRFVSVKKNSEITLDGVKADLDIVDKSVQGITLTDSKGHVVRIAIRNYNNLYIEVPAPPEKEKKHKLSGAVIGLPVDKVFDTKYDAEDEKRRLESETSSADLKIEEVELDIPF